ncbi:hypothetical protein [Cylindrospermum sp. FACHB-282]|uniref:hypothetical protein n=1 Tax=Cylindrospermum sp. FACHB-282 TaxID=2692794 RepID=UPI001682CCF7|nr:hypothetical protein [Cylindrospermum sp. FACHB-282]MBD2388249.1 hypothetical protein [Cylindrospermum sp. FACHB-282]
MSSSNWEDFLAEGKRAVDIVRRGLRNRGINAGASRITEFGTDEDIPVYGTDNEHQLFWISVKSVSSVVENLRILPFGYKGWMCGEVESKQWVNPPSVIIWYCLANGMAWGTIPARRLSTRWFIFPNRWGRIVDKRKTNQLGYTVYLYPSWLVLPDEIVSKEEVIAYIQRLSQQ